VKHPLDDLLSLAERSYVRLEAEQLIADCLHRGDPTPFNDLIEELVLAGTTSLAVLREILQAIRSVKSNLSQEGLGIRQDLMDALSEFGIHLPQLLSADAPESFRQICSQGLQRQVKVVAGRMEEEDESLLQEICVEAGNRVALVARRLVLLNRLEESVRDWISGLIYEYAHSAEMNPWPENDTSQQ
jgi:hypothetical protein